MVRQTLPRHQQKVFHVGLGDEVGKFRLPNEVRKTSEFQLNPEKETEGTSPELHALWAAGQKTKKEVLAPSFTCSGLPDEIRKTSEFQLNLAKEKRELGAVQF
jgi:hypothetical protein